MCGIVGYSGRKPAAPLLLEGLAKLEYRGYDSAGVALLDEDGLFIYKNKGRLQVLADRLDGGEGYSQKVGIGHTRWATHGGPSDENAHPHQSRNGRFAVVHNGIIENYLELKQELEADGVVFTSETDTEVVAQLLERCYQGDLHRAVRDTVAHLEGSYALGILCTDVPGVVYGVRKASPLIVGLGDDENFLASDIPAVLGHTRRILPLEDDDLVRLTPEGVQIWDGTGQPVDRPQRHIDWDVAAAEKGGYAHFMLKEIMEQPEALAATIEARVNEERAIVLDGVCVTPETMQGIRNLAIVACGSAYHAGVVGKYFLEKILGLPVEVDLASEFRYREPLVDSHTLTIIISQSGETADTLAALREAKARGARVLSIVNVVGSSIAMESDEVLYTWAGPEISVATTKGYTTQVSMLYLIGLSMATALGRLTREDAAALLEQVRRLPEQVREGLENPGYLHSLARHCVGLEHAYFIGRHTDYAVALEASLKLKEISYIHSEAYAAGELKHGTISLIEEGSFVVALACQQQLREKTRSNIKEVKARGARVLVVTTADSTVAFPEADWVLTVPAAHPLFQAIPEMVPLQLLSYYIALERGCDIDKPRNLAKSVTVE